MTTTTDASLLLGVAISAATQAGELLRERFHEPARGVGTKSTPTDLVSDADRDAEWLVRKLLRDARPDDGLIAEEGNGFRSSSGITWIVDPLDGTVNYLFGIRQWCVSIACRDEAGLLCGVVHDPNHSETFSAVRDHGAVVEGRSLSVRDPQSLAQAMISTGFSYESKQRSAQAAVVARLLPKVRDIRRMGSAALDLCSVASGRTDGFFEAPLEPWDRSAGEMIVREAGGVVSDITAAAGSSTGLVASGPAIHDELVRVVEGR